MTRFVDSIIAYRILRMLVTPFNKTDAFRLGIIDAKGNELKKMKELNNVDERDAYTILHRMIFRLKKIVEKVPVENKKLASLAAAYALIRENLNTKTEPIDLESQYLHKLEDNLTEELEVVNEFFDSKKMLTFKLYLEDAPMNNAAATPGVAGFTPETLGVKKKKKFPIVRRKEANNVV